MQQTLVKTEEAVNSTSITKRKGFRWLRFLIELFIGLIVVISLVEAIFSWAGIGEQECLKIDQFLGFSLYPNKDVTWRREGFSRVHFNSHGMQDREYSLEKPAGVKRIAVIGDSFVEALQVERKDNFCSQLEKLFNAESKQKVEVMNFGCQAHNLAQTYLNLKKSVMRFSPDVVILPYRPDATFLLTPDVKGGFLGARPNFFVNHKGELIEDRTVQKDWLNSKSGKRMRFTDPLREKSRIWGVIAQVAETTINWKKAGGIFKNFINNKNVDESNSNQHDISKLKEKNSAGWSQTSELGEKAINAVWPVADRLIAEMNKECNAHGCKLDIVRLPGVRGHVSALETRLLKETAVKNNIEVLDLTEQYHEQIKSGGKKLFFDFHFTEEGHKIMAQELENFLKN